MVLDNDVDDSKEEHMMNLIWLLIFAIIK